MDPVEIAVAAYRERGRWQVSHLTRHHLLDVETLGDALRRLAGPSTALGLVAADDETFLVVRVDADETRLLLSDAEPEWDLADTALEQLADAGLDVDGEDDEGRYLPPGHLDLLADLGLGADELVDLLDDDLDADEVLGEIADALGFGELFDALLDEDDGEDDDEDDDEHDSEDDEPALGVGPGARQPGLAPA